MTHAARSVLQDCELALEILEAEKDLQKWRVHWVGALSLIRAVGHVLHKVDGKRSNYASAIKTTYSSWKDNKLKHELFWEFIEKERNNVLKEYTFNLHPLDHVDVAVEFQLINQITGEPATQRRVIPIGENIYRPLLDSFREGDDARDVYQEAIDWWHEQLDSIDSAIA